MVETCQQLFKLMMPLLSKFDEGDDIKAVHAQKLLTLKEKARHIGCPSLHVMARNQQKIEKKSLKNQESRLTQRMIDGASAFDAAYNKEKSVHNLRSQNRIKAFETSLGSLPWFVWADWPQYRGPSPVHKAIQHYLKCEEDSQTVRSPLTLLPCEHPQKTAEHQIARHSRPHVLKAVQNYAQCEHDRINSQFPNWTRNGQPIMSIGTGYLECEVEYHDYLDAMKRESDE